MLPLRLFQLCLLLLFAAGCANKTMVALVPDPDGKVGHLTVTNSTGTVDISRAYQATTVADAKEAPAAPQTEGRERLRNMFYDALSVQPLQPIRFVLYFRAATTLTGASMKIVPEIARAIRERNSDVIVAAGYGDTIGTKQYNAGLSIDRALTVKELLVKNGINPAAILPVGEGEENPLVPTRNEVFEPRNRAVVVTVK